MNNEIIISVVLQHPFCNAQFLPSVCCTNEWNSRKKTHSSMNVIKSLLHTGSCAHTIERNNLWSRAPNLIKQPRTLVIFAKVLCRLRNFVPRRVCTWVCASKHVYNFGDTATLYQYRGGIIYATQCTPFLISFNFKRII